MLWQSIPLLSVLLRRDRHCSIPSVWISAPRFHSALYTLISVLLSLVWEVINFHRPSSVWVVAPMLNSTLHTRTPSFEHSSARIALLKLDRCSPAWIAYSSSWVGTSWFHHALLTPPPPFQWSSAGLDTFQSPLVLRNIDLALFFFIPHSCNTALYILALLLSLVAGPHFHSTISYSLSNPKLDSQLANITLHLWYISQIDANNIGIQFHPLTRYE